MRTAILDSLREQTRPQHERLHEVVDLRRMTASVDCYAAALRAYYHAVHPLEGRVRELVSQSDPGLPKLDWHRRLVKADWLSEDLSHFVSPSHAFQYEILPCEFPNSLEALVGCSYVMEGMTLGAMRISPLVNQQLEVDCDCGGRFFHAYGPDTPSMWSAYRHWVGDLELSEAQVIEVAQHTFRIFGSALSSWQLAGNDSTADA